MSHSYVFEVFRKGSIVPRRLRIALTSDRAAQRVLTFGMNCIFCNGAFYGSRKNGEYFINIGGYGGLIGNSRNIGKRMGNGTYRKSSIHIFPFALYEGDFDNGVTYLRIGDLIK